MSKALAEGAEYNISVVCYTEPVFTYRWIHKNQFCSTTDWFMMQNGSLACRKFNPFPNKFLHVCPTILLETLWEKEKLLVTNDFSFSHSVYYTFGEHSAIFIKFEIVVCKLFQFGRV